MDGSAVAVKYDDRAYHQSSPPSMTTALNIDYSISAVDDDRNVVNQDRPDY
jgi:hypothetical protein